MTRKAQTQVELERKIRLLEKELELLKRKYKRTLKQLSKFADKDLEVVATLEAEEEHRFQTPQVESEIEQEVPDYFEVELPNGSIKKIKKRLTLE